MKKIFYIILILLHTNLFSYVEIEIPTRIENVSKKFLKADLYSSDLNKKKPVILIQTPYNKNKYRLIDLFGIDGAKFPFDTTNYNIVIMDWRGFYSNSDKDSSNYPRGYDGYDAVEWIAEQKWSNGKIGTWGGSALGMVQFLTAAENPPHLVCSAPFIKDFKSKYEDAYYGGVFRKEHYESLDKLGLSNSQLILSKPYKDLFWIALENQNKIASQIKIPMLLCTGWFDHYPSDVIRAFEDLYYKKENTNKNKYKLIIGPWLHSSIGEINQGDLSFPLAKDFPGDLGKEFLDFYLLNKNNNWESRPNLMYYTIGDEIWESSENWGSIKRFNDTLYLNKDFKLTFYPPPPLMSPIEINPDTLIYNPKDPSPTIGGSRFNPFDKTLLLGPIDISKSVESRNDILSYTTDILDENYKINGKTSVELYFSSNREDTDFSIRLCDVYPDGRSIIITQGIQRARLRESLSKESLLKPNEVYLIKIELCDLSYTFLKNHRIRIDISSSNYPMFSLNLNNGKEMYKQGDTLIATNLIYRTSDKLSKIIFQKPILINRIVAQNTEDNISNENIFINLNPIYYFDSDYTYEVFATNGALIEKSDKTTNYFNSFNLSNGIYFILLKNNSNIKFKKLIKYVY